MNQTTRVWWQVLWNPGLSCTQLLHLMNWKSSGAMLSGTLHRLCRQGMMVRVAGKGPRGGYVYYVNEFKSQLPHELMG